jgi:hypothetical protein
MRHGPVIAAALVAALVGAPVARAQSGPGNDTAAQIKLIETQPADLDRAAWKDKRREAARKLGQGRDRRAVPVLIKLAETETFDIIGEIAIEALGNLGDAAAAPALQRILADPARDKAQRDLARKALAKLGPAPASPAPATSAPSKATAGAPGGAGTAGAAGAARSPVTSAAAAPRAAASGAASAPRSAATSGDRAASAGDTGPATTGPPSASLFGGQDSRGSSEPPALPAVDEDALAAYERVTFAAGTANLGYDTVRKRVDLDADLAGQYQKRIERESLAWGVDLGGHVVAGYINPDGPEVSRGAQVDVTGDGEARLYRGPVYGIGRVAVAGQINYVADVAANPNNNLKQTRSTADLQIAIGGGYGRLLDVGAAIRVRRLGRTLEAARALGRPIDPGLARRLQLTWWALRGERSTYRALVATVAILREAGVLLGEPDAGLSYEILNVLRDSQLYLRPSGFDLQLAFGEGYLRRPAEPTPSESGRVEQVLAQAGYGSQLDDDTLELSGTGYARARLFASDPQPSPWALGATARARRFVYGSHGDPLGAVDLSLAIELSDDDLANSQVGQRITGQLGVTWWMNPASGFRIAANLGEDRGKLFVGAQLTASYGLLDGTFAR